MGLAVPDEFDLALVFEQQEAVLLREVLALLDELGEIAAFGVGEFVMRFGGWHCYFSPSWSLAFPAGLLSGGFAALTALTPQSCTQCGVLAARAAAILVRAESAA